MSIQIGCAKGCGATITVSTEQIEEAGRLGAPLVIQHEVCPRDATVLPKYRTVIVVSKIEDDPDNEEELARVGDTVEAPTFAEAFDKITAAINKQWEKVGEMRHIIEDGGD